MSISAYQGGMPSLYTRYGPRQRGSGFFSTLKRFLIPIAKTALPHVAGAVGDLVAGKSAMDTLKTRGRAFGGDLTHKAANFIQGNQQDEEEEKEIMPEKKAIKRRAAPSKPHSSPKRKKKLFWS